jgi:hypothetical protein
MPSVFLFLLSINVDLMGSSCHRNSKRTDFKMERTTGHRWLTPVIPATQEAEIRRIEDQSQLREIVLETLCWGKKKTLHKKGLVEWLKVKVLSMERTVLPKGCLLHILSDPSFQFLQYDFQSYLRTFALAIPSLPEVLLPFLCLLDSLPSGLS